MNISGIRPYAGFYDYNTIKLNEVRSLQIQESKASEQAIDLNQPQVKQEENEAEKAVSRTLSVDNGAEEYAKRYQPDAVYELKGVDSDIANLDVERALSDMKKDQVLQQYQFFVGESLSQPLREVEEQRLNENFYL